MSRWLKTVGPLANKRVPSLQWRRDDAKALHLRFFERLLLMLHSWIDASFLVVFHEGSVSSRVSRCRRYFLSSVFCNFILLCCLLQFSKGVESPFLPDCSILHRVVSFKTALYQKRLPGSCLCSDCQSERGYRVVASVQTHFQYGPWLELHMTNGFTPSSVHFSISWKLRRHGILYEVKMSLSSFVTGTTICDRLSNDLTPICLHLSISG